MPVLNEEALDRAFAQLAMEGVWEPSGYDDTALSSELPVGILRCTFEKYPKVLYASQGILKFLGMTPDSEDWQELICKNIFFMIPFRERHAFRAYLDAAAESAGPVSLEHRVNHSSGSQTQLTGWLNVVETVDGRMEYHIIYIKAPTGRADLQQKRELAYQQGLGNVYDVIYEIDRIQGTLECIHQKAGVQIPDLRSVRILLDSVVKQEVFQWIYGEDRGRMEDFVQEVCQTGSGRFTGGMARREFRMVRGRGLVDCEAVAVELDAQTVLLCCRKTTGSWQEGLTKEEISELLLLRQAMEENAEQVMAFRLAEDRAFPAMGKARICRSCGIGEEEYARFREGGMALSALLERYDIPRADYQRALEEGVSAVGGGQSAKRVQVFKRDGAQDHAMLFLYHFNESAQPFGGEGQKPKVSIRTFGYFDVFVDGKPVVFHYEKSKEMFAVLVDRYGSFVSNPYIINCLWEDEPYGEKIQGRCRQTAHRMMQALKEYGIEDIIERVDGKRRIVPERVQCDYFDYMQGREGAGRSFNGTYMSDYTWGEVTLSNLMKGK